MDHNESSESKVTWRQFTLKPSKLSITKGEGTGSLICFPRKVHICPWHSNFKKILIFFFVKLNISESNYLQHSSRAYYSHRSTRKPVKNSAFVQKKVHIWTKKNIRELLFSKSFPCSIQFTGLKNYFYKTQKVENEVQRALPTETFVKSWFRSLGNEIPAVYNTLRGKVICLSCSVTLFLTVTELLSMFVNPFIYYLSW